MSNKLLIVDDVRLMAYKEQRSSPNPMHQLWDKLGERFDNLVLCLPVENVDTPDALTGTPVRDTNVAIRERPFFRSPAEFWVKSPSIAFPTIKILNEEIKQADAVFLRIPSVISPFTVALARWHKKPLVLQVKGWWNHIAETTLLQKGLKNYFAYHTVMAYERFHRRIAKAYPCLFMSQEDADHYSQFNQTVAPINVSLMSENDIYVREDTCLASKIQLLYVGRLAPTKGLTFLLESIAQMGNPNVTLKLVGHGAEERKLQTLAEKLGISDLVEFTGPLAHGSEIQGAYHESDIFVLPSLGEGFPKVLYEAAAAGLPIISTNVGGIPEKMVHEQNALLVEPADTQGLASAISRVINEPFIRRQLIQNNLEFAAANTIERTVASLSSFILEKSFSSECVSAPAKFST